jgi:dTDP-4-dehydrorhamnose 3,5-epimerase
MTKKFTDRKIINGVFDEVKLNQPSSYQDYRGYYYTINDAEDNDVEYVKDKLSTSLKNVLRGIHGDYKSTKLVTCVHGEVYCVIVDNRKNSDTYMEWAWEILSVHNKNILVLPPGVGLSYLITSESANIFYKWAYPGGYPDVGDQFTLKWNDKGLNIFWPIKEPILQPRDL